MIQRIALVSCVKSKQPTATRARDLYTSTLFRGMRAYAEAHADAWYILSAEHGLLSPDQVIEPYERTLNRMGVTDRKLWAERVRRQLAAVVRPGMEVIVLAGERYREGLVRFLREKGCPVTIPLEGLPFGKQLQRLSQTTILPLRSQTTAKESAATKPTAVVAPSRAGPGSVEADLSRFYDLLAILAQKAGQGRALASYSGRAEWPQRGVYFFREPGEFRTADPDVPRITRVGTHAVSANSQSRLWGRLRAHRGGSDGRGNHRGSIFRLHVGMALLQRDRPDIGEIPSWSVGQSAPRAVRDLETEHERRVSAYIGAMTILWVDVPDLPGPQSYRARIERNAIALLSNQLMPLDQPGPIWLGSHSPRDEIRRSGLWNLNHVRERYDPDFLADLAAAIERTA